jgi:uncharacterized damage-inducible protein DinB
MIRSIADFTNAWKRETEGTMKLFRKLTDASLAQRVTEDGRSLGFLAWHIVLTLGEMPGHARLAVEAPADDAPPPAHAATIAEAYEDAAKSVASVVAASWSDASLEDDIPMYGETWKKNGVLTALILHQAHHRGQMTVLMRQAGLTVPGIYGPAREEWALMGLPPMP